MLLVDASRPFLCALCGMSSPSALVSSLLGASAGKAMEMVVIGGRGKGEGGFRAPKETPNVSIRI